MARYAELHCHSAFSFLDGTCLPEDLVRRACELGLSALALTDHNGFYGLPRFAQAARQAGLPTVFGAELSIKALEKRTGSPDPQALHLVVLARNCEGYKSLSAAITASQLNGEKQRPSITLEELAGFKKDWAVLTGCRKGPLASALEQAGDRRACERELAYLIELFGQENVFVELWNHGDPLDVPRNDVLAELAAKYGLEVVAAQNAHYCSPSKRYLHQVLCAIRASKTLAEIEHLLPINGSMHLRSSEEQEKRFSRWPGAVENAHDLAMECAFDFSLIDPGLPSFAGSEEEELRLLKDLVFKGAARCYGDRSRAPEAYAQLEHELKVIGDLGFAGYFLLVHDIVLFCKQKGIMCQGRGSAANSAVCYALGITRADPVALGLLFERFLSPYREGPPDIDLDIEAEKREEVIQYVYRRYGRTHAAQVANVIEYRFASALRDAARALGYSMAQINTWSKLLRKRRGASKERFFTVLPPEVLQVALQLKGLPRHLGLHTGGMVISKLPVSRICPVEWATHAERSVLQWDKDGCAFAGFVKFDLLGLRMLQAVKLSVESVERSTGKRIDLSLLPQEKEVYDMLSRGDTVGVFQVESRAQLNTIVRLKPRCFYDLVIEVALIRPGPIQSGSVHPYLRRRAGLEPVTYLHPLLEPSLKKTLGVPIFQEQLMRMAMDAASFSAAEADALRAAFSSKRSVEAVERLKGRLMEGFAKNGIGKEVGEQIYRHLLAFADFGFPESHSISFAYITYASAWLKLHYPAAFFVGLLNSQPMGFWSPATLIEDARRHGIEVIAPDVNRSPADTDLLIKDPVKGPIILGLSSIKGISKETARRIEQNRPYEHLEDLVRKAELLKDEVKALIKAGATSSFEKRSARESLFDVPLVLEAADRERIEALSGTKARKSSSFPLPPESPLRACLREGNWTGAWISSHPMLLIRPLLKEELIKAEDLKKLPAGAKARVAGIVTHRQRPETAKGAVFVNLEDETGFINVTFSKGAWERWVSAASLSDCLVVDGTLERDGESINLRAELVKAVVIKELSSSRNFH